LERERWCRLLEASGIAADPLDLAIAHPSEPAPVAGDEVTLLHLGVSSPTRRWPLERWAIVADAQRRAGRRVVLTGAMADRPDGLVIARWAGLPEEDVLAGRTTLPELMALIAAAGRLVSGDTGAAHLATAFGTPSVVLFGPVGPDRWGPPADDPRHVALWGGEESDPFDDRPAPSLLALQAEDVLPAISALPSATARPKPERTTAPAS
jgi:ADP-heptose:LPS heptosyltransferase